MGQMMVVAVYALDEQMMTLLLAAGYEERTDDGCKNGDDEVDDSFPIDLFHFFSGLKGLITQAKEMPKHPFMVMKMSGLVGTE